MLYRIILLCSKIHIPTKLRVFLLRFVYPNISKNCRICNGIEIDIDSNNLYIGEGSYIGKESCIIGQHAQVRIGKNVMIAHRVNICVSTHPIMFGWGG